MISFGPSDEQNLVVETLKSFAADVLRPAARAADEAEKLPEDVLQQAWELLRLVGRARRPWSSCRA